MLGDAVPIERERVKTGEQAVAVLRTISKGPPSSWWPLLLAAAAWFVADTRAKIERLEDQTEDASTEREALAAELRRNRANDRQLTQITIDDSRANWDALVSIHRAVAPTEAPLRLPDTEERLERLLSLDTAAAPVP